MVTSLWNWIPFNGNNNNNNNGSFHDPHAIARSPSAPHPEGTGEVSDYYGNSFYGTVRFQSKLLAVFISAHLWGHPQLNKPPVTSRLVHSSTTSALMPCRFQELARQPHTAIVLDRTALMAIPRRQVFERRWPSPHVPPQYFRLVHEDGPLLTMGPCGHFWETADYDQVMPPPRTRGTLTVSCHWCKAVIHTN